MIISTEWELEEKSVIGESERKIEKLIEEKGSFQNQKEILKRDNEKLNQSLQVLLKKISVSEQKKKKLEKANLYIQALEHFVITQKQSKCSLLETAILTEVQK